MVQHGLSRLASKKFCSCADALENPKNVTTDFRGEVGTIDYRVFYKGQDGSDISPWHKIPLYSKRDGYFNFVCEIPRGTTAKYETSTKEALNPIKQDVKNGKVRNYGITMEWNYGMLPQTWEDPTHSNLDCNGAYGDNDPLDVVEIGNRTAKVGEVYEVKAISAYAMVDEGELDWKVICIAADDPRAELVNDVEDIETHFPGELSRVLEWFRTYKLKEGKPLNRFELGERPMHKEYTLGVIAQTHAFYSGLLHLHRTKQLAPEDPKLLLCVQGAPSPCEIHLAQGASSLERLESLKQSLPEVGEELAAEEEAEDDATVPQFVLPEYVRGNLEKMLSGKEIKDLLKIGLTRSSSLQHHDEEFASPRPAPTSPMSKTWT